jgi:hypothetical protein
MKTTVLLVEFLVVGLFALALLAWSGYVFVGWDLRSIFDIAGVGNWAAALLLLYALGVLWGRLADVAVKPIDILLKRRAFPSNSTQGFDPASYHAALLDIHTRHSALADAMAQVRSQYRIGRAAALTGALGLIVTFLQPKLRPAAIPDNRHYWAIVVVISIITALGLETYRHLRGHYLRWTSKHALGLEGSVSPHSVPTSEPL